MSKKYSMIGFEKTVLALAVALCCHGAQASYEDDQRQLQAARMAMSQPQNETASETQNQVQKADAVVPENKQVQTKAEEASDQNEVRSSFADKMTEPAQTVENPDNVQNNTTSLTATLLKQAYFWHDKKLHNKAMQTLNRLLMADPHHEEALFLMSLWSYENKDEETGNIYRDRLARLAPNSDYLQQLDNHRGMSDLSGELLSHARALSSSGNIAGALREYQKLFPGAVPPKALVSEYYLTMSGDPNYYDRAKNGVTAYIRQNPHDVNAQITLGKILSYRQSTIRQGIELLDYYAPKYKEADLALKQALMWFSPSENDHKYYQNYLSRHRGDTEVARHYDEVTLGNLSKEAFDKSKTDKEDAINDFKRILSKDPRNQNALEAVGYLYMELKNYLQAAEYLNQAAASGGSKAPKLKHDALLCQARFNAENGRDQVALSQLNDLLKDSPYDADALIFKAELARKNKRYPEAEEALRTAQSADPSNVGVQELLYYVLKEGGKNAEATALLSNMDRTLAEKIRDSSRVHVYVDPIPGIRSHAESLKDGRGNAQALDYLRTQLRSHPSATWLHYDLALAEQQSGDLAGAYSELNYLNRANASDEDLFAAASLQMEFKEYEQALASLNRIKSASPKVREMRATLKTDLLFSDVESYIASGNNAAALNTLRSSGFKTSSLQKRQLGHLAYLYLRAGDKDRALDLANLAMSRPASGNEGLADLADIISVYNGTGNYEKARALTENQRVIANSSGEEIDRLKNGESIRQADALRESNRSADAYDLLFPLIQKYPDDPDLQMAMARLYQDNGMYDEAASLYSRVLAVSPEDQQAVEGAMNAALGREDYRGAADLGQRLRNTDDPRILTLLARIDAKNHEYKEAIIKLKRARGLLDGRYDDPKPLPIGQDGYTAQEIAHMPGNPFHNRGAAPSKAQAIKALPWEVQDPQGTKASPWDFQNNGGANYAASSLSAADRAETLNSVNFMLRDLEDKVATTMNVALEARQKDGEEGFSKVSVVEVPHTVSTPVLGGAKLSVTADPVSMHSGDVAYDSASRFGSQALSVGVTNMVTRVQALQNAYKGMNQTEWENYKTNNAWLNALDPNDLQTLLNTSLNGADFALTSAQGRANLINYFGRFSDVKQVMAAVNALEHISTGMYTAKPARTTGVGFDIALSNDNYRFDLGASPVGKDSTTVIGGASYTFDLTRNSSLNITAERRAVKDSILSYYGYTDEYSGKYWGGVTKNGGSLTYSYDNGYLGSTLSGSFYRYLGENVRSNNSVGADAAVYVHPFKPTMYEDMTVGLSLSYLNFQHNENNFTLGNGGYFSPQNYFIASIPFSYLKRTENSVFNASLNLGYQSYETNEEPYFPQHPDLQSDLDDLVSLGFLESSHFAHGNESGVGGSAHLSYDYYLTDWLKVGAALNYSTFGDYNEMSEMIYIKSVLGGL